jgi:ketosteroid isomerase-like protein
MVGRVDSLDQATKRYHEGLRAFFKGDAGPVLQLFSRREDVVLCNPFHPFARGPREVAEAVQRAASHYADGVCEFETVTAFATAEIGYIVGIERFRATLDGIEGSGALRVTTILRLEDDGWRVAHRHADPITTPQPFASVLQR